MISEYSQEELNKLIENMLSKDSEHAKSQFEAFADVNFDNYYYFISNFFDDLNVKNKDDALKNKIFLETQADIFFLKIQSEDKRRKLLEKIKFKRDKIQNIFISMTNVLSNSNVNFKHKEETLRMLNTSLPICIDEDFEDYLTFFYVTSQLAAGVVYADSISASNKGSAPRRPDPSKQKAIDEAIMLWKRTPRLSLDDVAGLIRDAEISDKSHSIIKQWIAPFNPKRKK